LDTEYQGLWGRDSHGGILAFDEEQWAGVFKTGSSPSEGDMTIQDYAGRDYAGRDYEHIDQRP